MLLQEKIGKEGIRTMKENSADRLDFIKLARPQNLVVESLILFHWETTFC